MPDVRVVDFSNGLYVEGKKDLMPQGTLRRAKGICPTCTTTAISRDGSTLVQALDAHSVFRFDDIRYQGATTVLYRAGVSKKTGLDGTRLTFVAMPPTLGLVDYLFITGGGDLFKVDTAGTATQWGITKPATDFTAAVGAAGALTGVYQYHVTFLNTTTGTRSNSNTNAQSVTLSTERAELSSIPVSSDTQVDDREIWRTVSGGATFFLLTTLGDNTTTTLSDNNVDSTLAATVLPLDNDPPDDTFEDCEGPHDGRMWWCRDTAAGAGGRVYFSPQGRAEAVEGNIDVTSASDKTQKGVVWSGSFWVFSESSIFEIAGTGTAGIFNTRRIKGVPGTTQPHTVKPISSGILYQAPDGVRLFNGTQSTLVAPEPIFGLFQGKALEDLAAFDGVVAEVRGDEYIISDETTTLAVNTRLTRWRNLGVGCKAFYFEPDTTELQATFNSKVQLLEDEGVLTDDGTAISFEIETPAITTGPKFNGILQRVIIDVDSGSQALTPSLVIDDVVTALPNLNTSSRSQVTYTVGKTGKIASLRIVGTITAQVTVYEALFETYIPQSQLQGQQA